MRMLITQLNMSGVTVSIRKGQIAIRNPKPEYTGTIQRMLSNRRLALKVLRETKCDYCGTQLDEHELGGQAICFHCWIEEHQS